MVCNPLLTLKSVSVEQYQSSRGPVDFAGSHAPPVSTSDFDVPRGWVGPLSVEWSALLCYGWGRR